MGLRRIRSRCKSLRRECLAWRRRSDEYLTGIGPGCGVGIGRDEDEEEAAEDTGRRWRLGVGEEMLEKKSSDKEEEEEDDDERAGDR